ncbi:alanine racemase [Halalkalibacillus halophilus]|uniref:alanine racemase n=1 Tax=Halalkalibacillus halophilus TaxID=392827 RepID=UPI0004215755|nr:alanine racemase [Halalkalibacillus halophilus]
MAQTFFRDTWAEVDLSAIKHNINELNKFHHNSKKIYAVVKANGYGHGDIPVAKAAVEAGASVLAVATFDEALRLRRAFSTIPILVFGRIRPSDIQLAADHQIALTVYQSEWLEQAKQYTNDSVDLHVKIDTGMNRVGIRLEEEAYDVIKGIEASPFQLTGLYTHFATADEESVEYFNAQKDRFEAFYHRIKHLVSSEVEVHVGNSATSLRYKEDLYDAVRFGISMYGLYPSEAVAKNTSVNLQPAFTLYSHLAHVKQLEAGESISYGATYTAKGKEWIGTIPIGYGDGWIRKLEGFQVMIQGELQPIVGRICMDQMMVRLSQPFDVDSKVTLIGKSGGNVIQVEDVADYLETINYEIPCMINERVPRIHT